MTAPVVAAVIIVLALGTLWYFAIGGQSGGQQELSHSYSDIRDNNRPSNNVRRASGWSDDDECIICCIPLRSEDCMTLACTHRYHIKCIETWKKVSLGPASCPICRHKF